MTHFLAIDQGTTSSRAMIFNERFEVVESDQYEFDQHFPQNGWVEHDPNDIWNTAHQSIEGALKKASLSATDISAIGITNQRETTFIWDKVTGECIYPAIVWQDRRTSDTCEQLKAQGYADLLQEKTGLQLDPYFSATKIAWILDQVPGSRERAEKGELLFGTVDTFLLWKLTEGRVHATDASNASRTALFNIHIQAWDSELLKLFHIPQALLPEVKDSADDFGECTLFEDAIPIRGIAGDQSAATIGQACFKPGMMKCTFGTGAFMMLNTGDQVMHSKHRLLSTVCYRINGETTYGLEGSVFIAGAAIKWLKEKAHLIEDASESETFCRAVKDNGGVYFIPALTGLGAPHWKADARGAIVGLTRDSGQEQIVRAAVEGVVYQTNDLAKAMREDGARVDALRIDGGMVHNAWFCQFLSDLLNIRVEIPEIIETTVLGAAFLAALGVGHFKSLDEVAVFWQLNHSIEPDMPVTRRMEFTKGWDKALSMLLG